MAPPKSLQSNMHYSMLNIYHGWRFREAMRSCKKLPTSRSGRCSDVRFSAQQILSKMFLFSSFSTPKRRIWKRRSHSFKKEKRENPLELVCMKHTDLTAAVKFRALPFINIHTHTNRVWWWDSFSLSVLNSGFRMWSLLLLSLEITQPDFVVQK